MKSWLVWLIIILIGLFVAYWAYLSFFQPEPAPEETAQNGETTPPQEEEAGELVEVSVSGTSYSFTPATITIPAGSRVRLTFTNSDSFMSHTFTISSLGVTTSLVAPGGSQTIEFTAPSNTGSFEFICSVPGHEDLGMQGTLVVN